MSNPMNNSQQAIQRHAQMNQASYDAYRRRRGGRPVGFFGAIGRLIAFVITLAFVAGVAWFILAVVSRSGLG